MAGRQRAEPRRTARVGRNPSRQAVAEAQVRRRMGLHSLARGIRRPRRLRHRAGDLESRGRQAQHPGRRVRHRPRYGGTDDDGLGERGAQAQALAAAGFRRAHLVPVVQRTGRWLGFGGAANAGGKGRRRVGHQRPEDLDVRRPLFGLRHPRGAHGPQRAEAQGAFLLLSGHEVAGHRSAPHQADFRRRQLQRGVFHGCAGVGRSTSRRGRAGLASRADDADERTHGDWRRRWWRWLPAGVRPSSAG